MSQVASLPPWAAAVFRSQVAEAGRTPSGASIWRIADDPSKATISDQFRANAADYHARYAAAGHFQALFEQALSATATVIPPAPLVLDLGSGSGVNSVAPCLRLFPGARVVATDLSAELLAILGENLGLMEARDQVACIVMDAMGDHVAHGAFDLVTGASILHHLLRPQLGLAAAARALKPGGKAIFFEPFDGYSLIRPTETTRSTLPSPRCWTPCRSTSPHGPNPTPQRRTFRTSTTSGCSLLSVSRPGPGSWASPRSSSCRTTTVRTSIARLWRCRSASRPVVTTCRRLDGRWPSSMNSTQPSRR